MKNIFIFLVLNLLLLNLAVAQNECAADISQYTQEGLKKRVSLFKEKSNKIEKAFPSQVANYHFEDKVLLKNGIEVTFSIGGCAHYGYTFIFKGKEITKVKNNEMLKRAERLLRNLELNQNSEKDELLNAIAEAIKLKTVEEQKGMIKLPCGEAYCLLQDHGNQEIKIGYDFQL